MCLANGAQLHWVIRTSGIVSWRLVDVGNQTINKFLYSFAIYWIVFGLCFKVWIPYTVWHTDEVTSYTKSSLYNRYGVPGTLSIWWCLMPIQIATDFPAQSFSHFPMRWLLPGAPGVTCHTECRSYSSLNFPENRKETGNFFVISVADEAHYL